MISTPQALRLARRWLLLFSISHSGFRLLRKSEVYEQIDKLGIELKANIMACNISEDEKRDILKTMQANLAKI